MKSLTIALMLTAMAVSGAAVARDHDERGRGPGAPRLDDRSRAAPVGAYRGPGPSGFHPPAGPAASAYGGSYPRVSDYEPPAHRPGLRYARPELWGAYAPPPAAGPGRWRRGQFFPPSMRGEVVADYQRYHLRRPPPGFYWYRSGDDFVLAALSSGLIFEVVGGGY